MDDCRTADPLRAPHLAALIGWPPHGIDKPGDGAFCRRRARGGARCRSTSLGAEAVARRNPPSWLFQKITVQYHDAQPFARGAGSAGPARSKGEHDQGFLDRENGVATQDRH